MIVCPVTNRRKGAGAFVDAALLGRMRAGVSQMLPYDTREAWNAKLFFAQGLQLEFLNSLPVHDVESCSQNRKKLRIANIERLHNMERPNKKESEVRTSRKSPPNQQHISATRTPQRAGAVAGSPEIGSVIAPFEAR